MKLLLASFVLLALLAPLAPLADAHVESYSQTRTLQAGPYLVFFEARPTPPFAENVASMVAQISDGTTGALVMRVPVSVLVAGPGDFSTRKGMESDGTGYLVASMSLPVAGNYSARLFITDPDTNETHAADTEFEVFPNIAYRIRPVDSIADVYVGQRATLAFDVVDPVTLAPKPLADLQVKMEHWTEDHKTFLGEQPETATRVGTGAWRITPTVAAPGMYHIRFASEAGGFNYADVPLLHVYATSPPAVAERDTPGPAFALLVALVGVVALLRRR